MLTVSKNTLKIISVIVWIIGGLILLWKGLSLFANAYRISSEFPVIILVLIIAFIIGLVKSRFIMTKFCRKNLNRINRIKHPKIYQFFELKFFFFLTLMILSGITLSKLALGNYNFLLAVGALDFSLSIALITSTIVYLEKE